MRIFVIVLAIGNNSMYLNFHTHFSNLSRDVISVQNLIVGKDNISDPLQEKGRSFSAGIHPWYLDEENFEDHFHQLKEIAALEQVQIVGECGLDRLRGPALSVQQMAFEAQVKLAEIVKKPVLVHCVKCYSELLAIKKKLSPKVPMIIHGYNNKVELGEQLLKAGFSFSLGRAILQEGSNAASFLSLLPGEKLFLETDDQEISIEKVYEAAAVIRKNTVDELKDIIFANWMSLQKEAAEAPSIRNID